MSNGGVEDLANAGFEERGLDEPATRPTPAELEQKVIDAHYKVLRARDELYHVKNRAGLSTARYAVDAAYSAFLAALRELTKRVAPDKPRPITANIRELDDR
jgi:hypothetical protein